MAKFQTIWPTKNLHHEVNQDRRREKGGCYLLISKDRLMWSYSQNTNQQLISFSYNQPNFQIYILLKVLT